mgnify:CR=1 FL=1
MQFLYLLEKIRVPGLNELMLTITHLGEETAFLVIALIVSVYMLSGREYLMRELKALCGLFLPKKRVNIVSDYAHRTAAIFYKYFYGALLDALVVGVVVSVGLLIFRVPYAVLLGLLLGLLNIVPYFGAIIGCIGIALVTLLTNGFAAALGVVIFIIVVQNSALVVVVVYCVEEVIELVVAEFFLKILW